MQCYAKDRSDATLESREQYRSTIEFNIYGLLLWKLLLNSGTPLVGERYVYLATTERTRNSNGG